MSGIMDFTLDPDPGSNGQSGHASSSPNQSPYFSRLETNVKGAREVNLHRKTVITGPNKSGKTSHLSAIRLALTGKHPGCNSRQPGSFYVLGPDEKSVFAHLAGPLISADFKVALNDEGKPKLSWGVQGIPGDPEEMLPISQIGNLLALGPDKMREAIFRRFSKVTGKPKPKSMDASLEKVWEEAATSISTTDPVDFMAEIKTALGKIKRTKNAQAKFVDNKITETRGWLADAAAGAELIPGLEQDLRRAQAYESSERVRSDLAFKRGQLAKAGLEKEAATKAHEAGKVQVERITKENTTRSAQAEALLAKSKSLREQHAADTLSHQRLKAFREMQQISIDSKHSHSLFDLNPINPEGLQKAAAAMDQRVEKRQIDIKTAHADLAKTAREIQILVEAKTDATRRGQDALTSALQQLGGANYTVQHLNAEITGLEKGLGEALTYEGRPSHEIESELQKLKEAEVKSTQLAELMSDLTQLERDSKNAKLLEGEAARLQEHLVHAAKSTAEATVNRYMPEGIQAVLNVEDMEWRVIGADGRPHSKVSFCGAESNALTVALALAWTEGAPIRIVTLDADEELRGYDALRFGALCDRLGKLVDEGVLDQVILTRVRSDEVPLGWANVNLEVSQHLLSVAPIDPGSAAQEGLPPAQPESPAPSSENGDDWDNPDDVLGILPSHSN